MRWFEGAGKARLEHDRRIVEREQPGLIYRTQPDGSLALVGSFFFKLASGTPQHVDTKIVFPDDYPNREPKAYEQAGRFPRDADHHLYPDGRACLWLDVESPWRPADPDALAGFLDQLRVFYWRQLMAEAEPRLGFPGKWRAHGAAGHLEYLAEVLRMPIDHLPTMARAIAGGVSRNAACPCGRPGRVRYRKCHGPAIRRFRDRVEPQNYADVIEALRKQRRRGRRPTTTSTEARSTSR